MFQLLLLLRLAPAMFRCHHSGMGDMTGPEGIFYTLDQAVRVTGTSERDILAWTQLGLIKPPVKKRYQSRIIVRLFSFRNLLEARTISWLKKQGVHSRSIARVVRRMQKEYESPLTELTFGVVKSPAGSPSRDRVVFKRSDGKWESGYRAGQLVLERTIPIKSFAEELKRATTRDRDARRKPGRIERRRGVLGSAEVFAGTRIPVRAVLSMHKAGRSPSQILMSYPDLREPDVEAAIRRARKRTG